MKDELVADDLDDELDDETDADNTDAESDDIDEPDTDSDTDNIGDPSVEINVEDLIRELESDGFVDHLHQEKNARKRLEELMERRRAMRDLEDFDDYEI